MAGTSPAMTNAERRYGPPNHTHAVRRRPDRRLAVGDRRRRVAGNVSDIARRGASAGDGGCVQRLLDDVRQHRRRAVGPRHAAEAGSFAHGTDRRLDWRRADRREPAGDHAAARVRNPGAGPDRFRHGAVRVVVVHQRVVACASGASWTAGAARWRRQHSADAAGLGLRRLFRRRRRRAGARGDVDRHRRRLPLRQRGEEHRDGAQHRGRRGDAGLARRGGLAADAGDDAGRHFRRHDGRSARPLRAAGHHALWASSRSARCSPRSMCGAIGCEPACSVQPAASSLRSPDRPSHRRW